MTTRALIATLALLAGCAAAPPPAAVTTSTTLVWSRDLAFGADDWRAEAEARFGRGVVVLLCHGDAAPDGRWVLAPDEPNDHPAVQRVAANLRAAYPGRPIVLITCNPHGAELAGLPGVYYARRPVLVPPYEHDPSRRDRWAHKSAGTIWEMSDHP